MMLLHAFNEGMVELDLVQKKRLYVLSYHLTTLYFIAAVDAGKIKIGKTKHIHKRLSTLMTASPVPLKLLHSVQYDEGLERRVHNHLKKYRSHGEWFHADKPVVEFVRNVKERGIQWLVSEVGDAPANWMTYSEEIYAQDKIVDNSCCIG
jgi:hypothetical protein